MTAPASVLVGAANSSRRTATMEVVRQPDADGYQYPNPDVSEAERLNNSALEIAESPEFNYGVMGGTALWGAGSAAAGAVAAGGGVGAAGIAATASLGQFAVVAGAGFVGFAAGSYVGDKAADFVFGDLLGKQKVATEGDTPAREGDPIAHVGMFAGLLGAIVGALAAVAVVAIAVATCGTGLVVLAAAAAVGGFVAGSIASFASKAGQYGDNKGMIVKGSTNVFFEGRGVARTGDPVLCSDHPGVTVVAEGAKTVYANNRNIARVGHRSTCDGNINAGCKTIVETMETAIVFEIKDSRSPLLRWANVVVNLLPLPRTKGRPRAKTASTKGKGCTAGKCTTGGEPVDLGSGDFFQTWPVLDLPGTIPLRLTRLHRSTAQHRGVFGAGWADDWSQRLELGEDSVTYHTPEGTTVAYHTPDDEVQALNLREGRYCLFGRRSAVLRLYDRQTQQVRSFAQADGALRRLSDIEDLNGNRIRFEHKDGALIRIHHSDGYRLAVVQSAGRIASVHLLDGELGDADLLRCAYGFDGRLAECTSYQFGTLSHAYDAQGRMIRWRDTDRTRAEIDYDAQGRVLATRTGSGHYADRFEYDAAAGCTHYYDAEGGHSVYYHNADGLITRYVDPLGHEWLTEWDELTNKLSETDPLGRTTRYRYNDFGEPTEVLGPDGATQRYAYDARGALREVTRADGARWRFDHDARGNLTGVHDPDERYTGFRFDDRGQVLRRDNPDGSQWRYDYDSCRRLCEVIDPNGARTRLRQDVFGRVLEVEDALDQVTRYAYADHAAPRGSVATVTLPGDIQAHLTYDSERRLIAQTDGEGRTTGYQYGAFDLLEALSYSGGGGLHFAYDKLTRLAAVTNGVGETYRYGYDAAGRRVSETDYGGAATRYAYNAAGWLTGQTGADGTQTEYGYDAPSGRLVLIRHLRTQPDDADPVVEEIRLDYDDAGYLIKVANADAVVEYERDTFGRLLAERIDGREVRYEYDATTGLPSGLIAGQQVQWQHDANGALARLEIAGHAPLTIARDALGRDVQRRSAAGFTLHQRFDALSLLVAQQAGAELEPPVDPRLTTPSAVAGLPGGAPVQRTYRYDRALNPVQIDDRRWGVSRYRYDANSQVVGTHLDGSAGHGPLEEGFHYDGAQNLITRTVSDLPGVGRHDLHQQAGRVVQAGSSRYRYDQLGRLVEKIEHKDGFRPQHWHYRWNGDNRLVELITPRGERWRYAYDALGRRVRKFKVIPGGAAASADATHGDYTPPGGERASTAAIVGERYSWAQDQLIEAAPIYADGTVAWDRATAWAYAPGGVTPLAQHKAGKLWYIVTDHIGTPRELLDETGEVAWSNSPKLWGEQRLWSRQASNDDAVDCPLRFPGQYYDAESGLHYNRHRYYDPETTQYLSPDPIGLAGGARPQGYVDNPSVWVDPLGLAACFNTAADPRGITFQGTGYRYENPARISTTWEAHQWNIAANHRYSGPGSGAVYASTSPQTALAEINHYNAAAGRNLVSKDFSADNVLDLTDPAVQRQLGVTEQQITDNDYALTQQIGNWAKSRGYGGILAPSARDPGGSNLIVFP